MSPFAVLCIYGILFIGTSFAATQEPAEAGGGAQPEAPKPADVGATSKPEAPSAAATEAPAAAATTAAAKSGSPTLPTPWAAALSVVCLLYTLSGSPRLFSN